MGNRSSIGNQDGFSADNWIEALEDAQTTRFAQVNPYRKRLLMSKMTSQLVQEYQLRFYSQSDFNTFTEDYEQRKKMCSNSSNNQQLTSPFIYEVKYFRDLTVNQLCTTIYSGMLYIEKVDLRLKEINDIPFQDQLYLYKACLSGFRVLYQKYGAFEITQNMVFFDQKGRIRVWINPNLSKFQPNLEPEYYNHTNCSRGSQSQMLKNLISIINHNCDHQQSMNNITFKEYLKTLGMIDRLSFSKVVQYFEAYLKQYRLQVGNYMGSIYELFNPGKSLESQEVSFVEMVNYQIPTQNSKVNSFRISGEKFEDNIRESGCKEGSGILNRSRTSQKSWNSVEYQRNSLSSINKSTYKGQPQKTLITAQNLNSALTFNPKANRKVEVRKSGIYDNPSTPFVPRYQSQSKNGSTNEASKGITFSYIQKLQGNTVPRSSLKKTKQRLIRVSNMQSPQIKNIVQQRTFQPPQSVPMMNTQVKEANPTESSLSSVKTDQTHGQKKNYFTGDSEYLLDQQIAQDMVKYLSIDPRDI